MTDPILKWITVSLLSSVAFGCLYAAVAEAAKSLAERRLRNVRKHLSTDFPIITHGYYPERRNRWNRP